IKTVTHEEVTKEALGGAHSHNARSGVAHFAAADDRACLLLLREILSFLPSNNHEDPPFRPTSDPVDRLLPEIDSTVPVDPSKPYDIRHVIRPVVDDQTLLEVHAEFARNIVVGVARIGGRPVGIVANQPAV